MGSFYKALSPLYLFYKKINDIYFLNQIQTKIWINKKMGGDTDLVELKYIKSI